MRLEPVLLLGRDLKFPNGPLDRVFGAPHFKLANLASRVANNARHPLARKVLRLLWHGPHLGRSGGESGFSEPIQSLAQTAPLPYIRGRWSPDLLPLEQEKSKKGRGFG